MSEQAGAAVAPTTRPASGRRRWVIVGLLVVAAIVVAGVGFIMSGDGSSGPVTYEDPEALISALGEEGFDCTGLEEVQGADDAPFRAATCDLRGRTMVISVSLTNELPGPYAMLFQEHDTGQPAVVGPNWVIEAPYDELPLVEEIRDALGGKIMESHLTDKG